MRQLLKAWSKMRNGRGALLDILYVNNEQELVLRRQPGLVRLFSGRVMRSRADAIADRKILPTNRMVSTLQRTGKTAQSTAGWRKPLPDGQVTG